MTHTPITDTVKVYHFVVSTNKAKPADTTLLKSYSKESKDSYDWITKQAKDHGQNLYFKEYWASNKDSTLKKTFVYRLPSSNLIILSKSKSSFEKWVKKKTENKQKRAGIINWQQNLFNSLAASINDTSMANIVYKYCNPKSADKIPNQLFVVHVMKVKKNKILGFYNGSNAVFIGYNKSRVIAHESIHYLGAPDIYIHRYWFGRRRRIVRKKLPDDIMNSMPRNDVTCNNAELSNYTAYCVGWINTIDKKYKPLLNYNLMAVFDFNFLLR